MLGPLGVLHFVLKLFLINKNREYMVKLDVDKSYLYNSDTGIVLISV